MRQKRGRIFSVSLQFPNTIKRVGRNIDRALARDLGLAASLSLPRGNIAIYKAARPEERHPTVRARPRSSAAWRPAGESRFRHYVTAGFRAGGVGERREEENGRRGYGKRAGTSCDVRAARREIVSFAIDRAKKGRRTSAGEGLPPLLAVARPVGKLATRTRTRGDRRRWCRRSVRPPIARALRFAV